MLNQSNKEFENYGPTLSEFDHQTNYKVIQTYCVCGAINTNADYIWIAKIKGIDYYTPNNEDWGSIVAMSHSEQLAADTHFYEMDDMEYRDSEYAFVVDGSQLIPIFQLEK